MYLISDLSVYASYQADVFFIWKSVYCLLIKDVTNSMILVYKSVKIGVIVQ